MCFLGSRNKDNTIPQSSTGVDHGQSDILTTIIACIKKGYRADKKKGTKVVTGLDAVNISEEYNIMGIYYPT